MSDRVRRARAAGSPRPKGLLIAAALVLGIGALGFVCFSAFMWRVLAVVLVELGAAGMLVGACWHTVVTRRSRAAEVADRASLPSRTLAPTGAQRHVGVPQTTAEVGPDGEANGPPPEAAGRRLGTPETFRGDSFTQGAAVAITPPPLTVGSRGGPGRDAPRLLLLPPDLAGTPVSALRAGDPGPSSRSRLAPTLFDDALAPPPGDKATVNDDGVEASTPRNARTLTGSRRCPPLRSDRAAVHTFPMRGGYSDFSVVGISNARAAKKGRAPWWMASKHPAAALRTAHARAPRSGERAAPRPTARQPRRRSVVAAGTEASPRR